MADEARSISVNGSISAKLDTKMATGAGQFSSRTVDGKQRWYAAQVAETFQVSNPNPNERDRIIDVVRKGPDGKPVMHLDPAAVESIAAYWAGQPEAHDWIPTMAFNEPKEPIREAVMEMKEVILAQSKAQTEAFANLANILASVLAGRPIPSSPTLTLSDAPRRRGRPPKVVAGATHG